MPRKHSILLQGNIPFHCKCSTSHYQYHLFERLFSILLWVGQFLTNDFKLFLSSARLLLTFLSFGRFLFLPSMFLYLTLRKYCHNHEGSTFTVPMTLFYSFCLTIPDNLKLYNIPLIPKMVGKVITHFDSAKAPDLDCTPKVALKNCETELSYISHLFSMYFQDIVF